MAYIFAGVCPPARAIEKRPRLATASLRMGSVSSSSPRLKASRSAKTRVASFMACSSSLRFLIGGHAVAGQILAHLRGIFELNRVHPQFLGNLEIQAAVIHENAFIRRALRKAQGHAIDFLVRLAHAQIARAQKSVEVLAETESPDSVLVDLARFIVQREHRVTLRGGELLEILERFRQRLREIEDKFLDVVGSKGARAIENDPLKIFIEGGVAGLERVEHQLVAISEIFPVEREVVHNRATTVAIPSVRQDHAAIVPKHRSRSRH